MKLNVRKIQKLLYEKGLTQAGLANKAGLSRPTVNNVLCGRTCSPNTAFAICKALGVDADELTED